MTNDPVKDVFGKSAEEILSRPATDHSKYHSPNAFCGNAGPEELKHLSALLDDLSDDEIVMLVDGLGIHFGTPIKNIDRDTLEGVIDEADREVFYCQYHQIIEERKK